MRLRSWCWLLVWMVGILGARGEMPTALQELPEGFRIWARAESLEALVHQTKATLAFPDGDRGTVLLWTGKTTGGQRYFRLATAVKYEPKAGKKEWLVTEADDIDWMVDAKVLPRITVTTQGKPKEFSVAAETWWQVVARDAQQGTVYEVEYYYQLSGEAAQGQRLVIMEDTKGQWQFVTLESGNYWDDTGWMAETRVRATWTGKTQEPVELRVLWHGEARGDPAEQIWGKGRSLWWGTESRYEGKLPLVKPVKVRHFVKVRKGDTFNGIIKKMVEWDASGVAVTVTQKGVQELRQEIIQMNPGLKLDHLLVGQEIEIPPADHRQAIEEAKKAVKQ